MQRYKLIHSDVPSLHCFFSETETLLFILTASEASYSNRMAKQY